MPETVKSGSESADAQPRSLGLVGDGDEIALVEDVERAFGVRFTDEEVGTCLTVGDLHRLVARRLPLGDGKGCATALCFYRLRKALQPLAPDTPLKPDTPMTVFAQVTPAELNQLIEARTGLDAPPLELSGLAALVALVGVAGAIIGTEFGLLSWWIGLALIAASLTAAAFLPKHAPRGIDTFANLAERVAIRNIGILARQGARLNEQDAWLVLAGIASVHTDLPREEIAPETLLIEPR